jgi:hypothetical protein
VFWRFEGWRSIWLNCCCETAAQPFTGWLGWLATLPIDDELEFLSVMIMIIALFALLFLLIAFLKFIWRSNYKSKGLRFDEFKFYYD